MTVSSTTLTISYSGNDTTSVFAVPFRVIESDDLIAKTINDTTLVETVLVYNTDYTVAIVGDETATLTTTNPVATGETLVITRATDKEQNVDYNDFQEFPAEIHEKAIDKLTCITQELQSSIAEKASPEDLADYQPISEKGQADGYASLDGLGKIPAVQLPSFVDDILEYADFGSFPATGEAGKIYIAIDTELTYRWTGTAYALIASGSGVWGSITGLLSNQTDLQAALDAKQAALTFDLVPTNSSTNPVESNGIYDALILKEDSANKVTAFQVTPDDTHYASEKLVKDSLDLKYDAADFNTDFDTRLGTKTTEDIAEGTFNFYDKTVTFIGGTNVTIGGVYPNFNINDVSASDADLTSHTGDATIHFTEASIDHGSIAGILDDDHTQYALLLGRAGGQTIAGGTGAGEDLTLSSTTDATKGLVIIDGQLSTGAYTFPTTDGINGQFLTTDGAGTLSFVAAISDHGGLTGLSDDDHSQYLLLAGRSGQQITDDLTLIGSFTFGINDANGYTVFDQTAKKLQITLPSDNGSNFFQLLNQNGDAIMSISSLGIIQSELTDGFEFIDSFTLSDRLYLNSDRDIYLNTNNGDNLFIAFDTSGILNVALQGDKDGTSDFRITNSDSTIAFRVCSDAKTEIIKNIDTDNIALNIQDYSLQGGSPTGQTALIESYTDRQIFRIDSVVQAGYPMFYGLNSTNATRRPDLAPTFVGQADYLWFGSLDIATPFYKWLYTGEELWLSNHTWKVSHNGTALNPAYQWRAYGTNTADFRWRNPSGYVDFKTFDNGGEAGIEYAASATTLGGVKWNVPNGEFNLVANEDVNIDSTAGSVSIEGLAYPSADGTAGQVMQTNGSGVLSLGGITASTISDFDTEVSNNTDVAANTTHRTSTGADHTFIDQSVVSGATPTFTGTNFSGIDHGTAVLGLSDDDHTQYALLAGRAGGQTLYGGSATGNDLTLYSNTLNDGSVKIGTIASFINANKQLIVGATSFVQPYTSFTSQGNASLIVRQPTATAATSPYTAILLSNNQTDTTDGNIAQFTFMNEAEPGDLKRTAYILAKTDGSLNSGSLTLSAFLNGVPIADQFVLRSSGYAGFGQGTPTARVHAKGSGNTSATYTAKFENSDGTKGLYVRDDGRVEFRNYYFPVADGTAGQFLITDGAGALSFTSPAYAEMYQVNNATATTINTVNVWEEINNYSEGETSGITFSASDLTVGTGGAGKYHVAASICGIPAAINKTFEFAFSVNNTIASKTIQKRLFSSSTDTGSVSLHGILNLADSDVVKVEIRNVSDDSNFTIQDSNVTIHRIL